MRIERYLCITASCSNTPKKSARGVEEAFADLVSEAISPTGRISNYSVDWTTQPRKFLLRTMVWRETNSSQIKTVSECDKIGDRLKEMATPIRKALKGFREVRIALITNISFAEIVN